MLELKDVSLSFGALEVLRGASLTLGQGERIAITGPSGCGKTSLLHVIAGLLHPDSGLVRNRAARMGCVFQEPRLLPWLSAEENVSIVMPHGTQGQDALMLLKKLGLADSAEKHPCELSGGMQQRAALARALAYAPDLLLLDEPAAGMNPHETEELMETIRYIRDSFDMTILLIEHDMKFVSGLCDEVTVLNFGTVLAQGDTRTALSDPEVIKAYIGG